MSIHISFENYLGKLQVLIVGFEQKHMRDLVEFFSDKKYVADVGEAQKKVHYSWIVLNGITPMVSRIFYRAYKDKAAVVLFLSRKKYSNMKEIEKQLVGIHAGVPVYLIGYNEEPKGEGNIADKELEKIILGRGEEYRVFAQDKVQVVKEATGKSLNLPGKKLVSIWAGMFVCVAIFIGILGGMLLTFYLTLENMDRVVESFKGGDLAGAQKQLKKARFYYALANSIEPYVVGAVKPFFPEQAALASEAWSILDEVMVTFDKAVYLSLYTKDLGQALFVRYDSVHLSQVGEFQRLTAELRQKYQFLSEHIVRFKGGSGKYMNYPAVAQRLAQAEVLLDSAGEVINLVADMSALFPELLGYEGARSYLILLQNNSELRPTGGFIGSWGIVRFANGRMTDFKIEDVYTADGQLKGHVEPPSAIRKYLGQENWYLRDSNFDPDFSVSASQAEWFLKREMDLQFDGVFAFDLTSVKYLLEGLGEVRVGDYGERITAENLFLKVQTQVENNFFPGSTQKRDFIGSLARNIFINLSSGGISSAKVVRAVGKSLSEKHIFLYFHDGEAQAIVEQVGWGGRVGSVACDKSGCTPDYLMLVEANLGINKANFLVERKVDLTITETPKHFAHSLSVRITNESLENVYPGGPYLVYLRILLPAVQVSRPTVDGSEVHAADVTISEYGDKTMVGFPVSVRPQGAAVVGVEYVIPKHNAVSELELLVQKQGGVNAYPLTIKHVEKAEEKKVVAGSQITEREYMITGDQLISL